MWRPRPGLISPGGLFRRVEIENGGWQRNVQVSLQGGQGPKLPVLARKTDKKLKKFKNLLQQNTHMRRQATVGWAPGQEWSEAARQVAWTTATVVWVKLPGNGRPRPLPPPYPRRGKIWGKVEAHQRGPGRYPGPLWVQSGRSCPQLPWTWKERQS